MKEIIIESHRIGSDHPPFVVAELSGNHNGSYERMLQLLNAAKTAGAHAVKLQTYTPDTITLNIHTNEFLISDQKSLWKNRTLYDLYAEAHTPWEWHAPIFEYCRSIGLTVFSTPFDETAVDFLENLNVPCYKIGSPEIVDLHLIKKVAETKKPLIISTGAASSDEIQEAVKTARNAGCKDLILLKCTAAYPASPQDMNLRTIPDMEKKFNALVGLSDHSLGIGVSIASVALGACFIEKHLTLSREEGGVDSAFSMEPQEFQELVVEVDRAWKALGKVHYSPLPSEKVTHSHRPSLYFVEDIQEGTTIEPQHIRSVRPAAGLPPKEWEHVIGKTLIHSVKKGTPVSWDNFK